MQESQAEKEVLGNGELRNDKIIELFSGGSGFAFNIEFPPIEEDDNHHTMIVWWSTLEKDRKLQINKSIRINKKALPLPLATAD